MKGQEMDVWNAVFAAAFVQLHWVQRVQAGASCVHAIGLADLAVRELRDRREHGDERAGKVVR